MIFPENSDEFCMKVWRSLQERLTIFQENLMTFAVKSADSYFQLVHMFFITIILIQQNSSDVAAKIVKFSCKNSQIFLKN